MSRDRQIAVLASIVGLAGLIVGIVAISQVSGANDEWVRNRALPGDSAATSAAASASESDEREIRELSDRLERLEERQVAESQESTDDSSDETAEDREAASTDRDDSDLGAAQSAASEEAEDRDGVLFEFDAEDLSGNEAEQVTLTLELDEEGEVGDEIADEVGGEIGDQAGAWASQEEVLDVGQRLPDDTSATQDGTLQSFSTDGVPAFIDHIELGVTIPELIFVLDTPPHGYNIQGIPNIFQPSLHPRVRALCNYLYVYCDTLNESPSGIQGIYESYSLYEPLLNGGIKNDPTFETDTFSDKYLTYELHCPNRAKLFDENVDNFPSIKIRKNNKYSSYAYSKNYVQLPWPSFPLQESLPVESWEVDASEYTLLSRPWLTGAQRDLAAMYEALYYEADANGNGIESTTLGISGVSDLQNFVFKISPNKDEFYEWRGWMGHHWSYGKNEDFPKSASELYAIALVEKAKKPNYTPITSDAFYEAFWQKADKASLVEEIEKWPPHHESFWGKMHDMIDFVPSTVDSRSLVRINDGISGEYHWALITTKLSWQNPREIVGGYHEGQCSARISITRSYE